MITIIIKSLEMAESERRIKEKEIQIQQMEREKLIEKHIEEDTERLCELFNTMIEKAINQGHSWYYKLVCDDYVRSFYNFWKSYKQAKQIFEKVGYKITNRDYSDSWRYKSGKVSDLCIKWE